MFLSINPPSRTSRHYSALTGMHISMLLGWPAPPPSCSPHCSWYQRLLKQIRALKHRHSKHGPDVFPYRLAAVADPQACGPLRVTPPLKSKLRGAAQLSRGGLTLLLPPGDQPERHGSLVSHLSPHTALCHVTMGTVGPSRAPVAHSRG